MFGPLILLAASVAPLATASPTPSGRADAPPRLVTARATASITILTGVRFGPGQQSGAPDGQRRKAELTDADGSARPAELLEFQ